MKTALVGKRALEEKLNTALYEAAAKAGMRKELERAQVEVFVSEKYAYVSWEHELCEIETFVVPRAAIARAEKWLAKFAPTMGLVTR